MPQPSKNNLGRKPPAPARDDRIDEELERERLEPGLNAGGQGDTGADPATPRSDGNSNT